MNISQVLESINDIASNENEEIITDYIMDNSDPDGFEGSMKDISEIMEIPVLDVLKFHNILLHQKLIRRMSPSRHNFIISE